MSIQSFKKHIFLRFINCIVLLSFLCTVFPVKSFAARENIDNLRPLSLSQKDGGTSAITEDIKESGIFTLLKDKKMKDIYGLFKLAVNGSKEEGGVEAYTKLKETALKSPEALINYFETLLPVIASSLSEDIFGKNFGYDIRGNTLPIPDGVINLTPNDCYLTGKALGKIYARHGDTILITGDQRWHTPTLRLAMALGFISVGVNADFSDEILGTGEHGLLSGENPYHHKIMIQISGSHNVPEKNGAKIKIDKGDEKGIRLEPLYGVGLSEVYTQIKENKLDFAVPKKFGHLKEIDGLVDEVVKTLDKSLPKIDPEQPILFDCRNSALIDVLKKLVEKRGLKNVRWYNDTPDPSMPGGIWDPSKPAALVLAKKELNKWNQQLKTAGSAYRAVAFIFDGDGDRATAILEDGSVVPAFEMTLPFYQRFISDPINIVVIKQLRKAGFAEKIWLACDIRATSALMSLIDTYPDYAGYYIQPGYPPQRDFVRWRIAELNKFVDGNAVLAKDMEFIRNFDHFKNTYFTAEASGHEFFHICPTYPDKVIDAGIAVVFNLLYIKKTIPANEAKDGKFNSKLPKKSSFELIDLFKAFPKTFSSDEVRIVVPNSIKAKLEQIMAKKLKGKYKNELIPTNVVIRKIDDMIIQPKEQGAIEVEGIKIQLKSGGSALFRKSNTDEKATLIFEGANYDELIRLMSDMEVYIKEAINELITESAGSVNIAEACKKVNLESLVSGRIKAQLQKIDPMIETNIDSLTELFKAKNIIHKGTGGNVFDAFVDTNKGLFQSTDSSVLVIDSQFFLKTGAVQGVQKLTELLSKQFKIGLYGKAADKLKVLLGGSENIITADTDEKLIEKLRAENIKSRNIVALRSSPGLLVETQLVFSKDGLAIMDLAKAIERVQPSGKQSFDKLFSELNNAGVIAEKSYDAPIREVKDMVPGIKVQEYIELPAIKPTESVAGKIEKDIQKVSAFMTDTFI